MTAQWKPGSSRIAPPAEPVPSPSDAKKQAALATPGPVSSQPEPAPPGQKRPTPKIGKE